MPKNSETHIALKTDKGLDALIRSATGAVPFIGTALGELLTIRWTMARNRRLQDVFDRLGQLIAELGESKLDKKYIESEDFQQLLIICLDAISRERRDAKRQAFVNILANAMTARAESDRTRGEWYAGVLSRQSYYHLVALRAIVSTPEQRQQLIDSFDDSGDLRALIGCTKDLTGAGFIFDYVDADPSVPERTALEQIWNRAQLTSNGEEYVSWMSEPLAAETATQKT